MFSFENIRSYIKTQMEISRNAVKLVKYKDRNVLSITTVRYKRIMFTHIKGGGNRHDRADESSRHERRKSGRGIEEKAVGQGS